MKMRVILAYYNGSKYIEEQLNSIVNQNLEKDDNLEICIYDDGSKAYESKKLDALIKTYKNKINVIRMQNKGATMTFLDATIDAVKDGVDFIAFSDQDDVWREDKLKLQCKDLVSSGAALSTHLYSKWDPESGKITKGKKPGISGHTHVYSVSNFVIKDLDEILQNISKNEKFYKFMNINYHDDLLMNLTLMGGGDSINCDEHLVKHRVHSSSLTNNGGYEHFLRNAYWFDKFNKYKYFYKPLGTLIGLRKKDVRRGFVKKMIYYENSKFAKWWLKGYYNFALIINFRGMFNMINFLADKVNRKRVRAERKQRKLYK